MRAVRLTGSQSRLFALLSHSIGESRRAAPLVVSQEHSPSAVIDDMRPKITIATAGQRGAAAFVAPPGPSRYKGGGRQLPILPIG
jgi:hypothetical protein